MLFSLSLGLKATTRTLNYSNIRWYALKMKHWKVIQVYVSQFKLISKQKLKELRVYQLCNSWFWWFCENATEENLNLSSVFLRVVKNQSVCERVLLKKQPLKSEIINTIGFEIIYLILISLLWLWKLKVEHLLVCEVCDWFQLTIKNGSKWLKYNW